MATRATRRKAAAPFRIRASIGGSSFEGEGPRAQVMEAYHGWVAAVMEAYCEEALPDDPLGQLDEHSTAH